MGVLQAELVPTQRVKSFSGANIQLLRADADQWSRARAGRVNTVDLNEDDKAELMELFKDLSGGLSHFDDRCLLRAADLILGKGNYRAITLKKAYQKMDTNQDNKVAWPEFRNFMASNYWVATKDAGAVLSERVKEEDKVMVDGTWRLADLLQAYRRRRMVDKALHGAATSNAYRGAGGEEQELLALPRPLGHQGQSEVVLKTKLSRGLMNVMGSPLSMESLPNSVPPLLPNSVLPSPRQQTASVLGGTSVLRSDSIDRDGWDKEEMAVVPSKLPRPGPSPRPKVGDTVLDGAELRVESSTINSTMPNAFAHFRYSDESRPSSDALKGKNYNSSDSSKVKVQLPTKVSLLNSRFGLPTNDLGRGGVEGLRLPGKKPSSEKMQQPEARSRQTQQQEQQGVVRRPGMMGRIQNMLSKVFKYESFKADSNSSPGDGSGLSGSNSSDLTQKDLGTVYSTPIAAFTREDAAPSTQVQRSKPSVVRSGPSNLSFTSKHPALQALHNPPRKNTKESD
eukprot:gene29332-8885_t